MAQVVLGVAGMAVGSLFGMPQVGWAVGSMLGAALFPPKGPSIEGPRLSDLSVQTSTQGQMIPRVYGCSRIGGNIIWSTKKIETKNVEEVGGSKGGGGGTTSTFTYLISLAVSYAEGEIKGVRKVWANKSLIFDASTISSASSILASEGLDQGSTSKYASIRFYSGSEDQDPDPLIQSLEGDDLAYRGTAYVVFEDLQLADFGNNVPQFEFEIVNNESNSQDGRVLAEANNTLNLAGTFDTLRIRDFRDGNAKIDTIKQGTSSNLNDSPNIRQIYVSNSVLLNPSLTSTSGLPKNEDDHPITSVGYNLIKFVSTIISDDRSYNIYADFGFAGGKIKAFRSEEDVTGYKGINNDFSITLDDVIPTTEFIKCCIPVNGNKYVMVMTALDGTSDITKWYIIGFDGISKQGTCNIQASTYAFGNYFNYDDTYSTHVGMVSDNLRELIISNNVYKIKKVGLTYQMISYRLITTSFNAMSVFVRGSNHISVSKTSGIIFSTNLFYSNAESDSPTLSYIVSDLCETAGVDSSQIDVSQLANDKLRGYVVNSVMSIRSTIEPLMQAFFFDAVESDNKIKFVKRGQSPVLTIPNEEIAAFEGASGDELPDDIAITRAQSVELPTEITVNFLDYDRDYQQGAQYARRETEPNKNQIGHDLAMVLTAEKARQIADVLLSEVWMSRMSYRFTTSRRYSYLEPTDIIVIYKKERALNLRITKKTEGQNGVIDWEAVEEDSSIYNSNVIANTSKPIQQEIAAVIPTISKVLDIPILKDYDNNYGMYVAMSGSDISWKSGALYQSDDNSTYKATNVFVNSSSIFGNTLTKLESWDTDDNRFDEKNTLLVKINNGSLSSDTEINVLNGSNYALVGSEIVQFKNASLVSTNTYLLSGFLRSRKGTEWAVNTHQDIEDFVLLDVLKLGRYADDISKRDVKQYFKAVTQGQNTSAAYSFNQINTGSSLKPYSVSHLRAVKENTNDIKIKWIRRSRINGEWTNGMDVSLGEQVEKYDVEIYSDSMYNNVKRIVNVGSQECLYSSENQIEDFGSNQTTLYVRIYQISDLVGRGFVKEKELKVI